MNLGEFTGKGVSSDKKVCSVLRCGPLACGRADLWRPTRLGEAETTREILWDRHQHHPKVELLRIKTWFCGQTQAPRVHLGARPEMLERRETRMPRRRNRRRIFAAGVAGSSGSGSETATGDEETTATEDTEDTDT